VITDHWDSFVRLIVRETAFDGIFGFSQEDITVQMWHVFKYELEVKPSATVSSVVNTIAEVA